jgi:protein SCO1
MKNRRAMLAAGAAALPVAVLYKYFSGLESVKGEADVVPTRTPGPSARFFPNVALRTHTGDRVLFYDDLIRDKIVTINFMSIRGDAVYPVTSNLVKCQRLLGDRVGRDIFMYSVSVDPEHDTPERLRDFAAKHDVGPGWTFLTGDKPGLKTVRDHLFARRPAPGADIMEGMSHRLCCSIGLVRYGNEALARWASFPARINPESIVERFSWVGMRPALAAKSA